MSNMEYENETRGYDEEPAYPRDRSRSPRADRDGDARIRSASPDRRGASPDRREERAPASEPRTEDDAPNSGSNLFVTGIHPRLSELEVQRLFEKYGDVESCSIMRDPHTRESRGFGFVKMVTSDQADAAKQGLQGETYEGRTLSIEKARRSKPRTPTPGKYFGPPKREDDRPSRGGGYRDRYDDRRPYGGGRRDDFRGGGGGYRGDRYDDRDRGYSRRDDYPRERYGGRDDRYGGGRDGGRDDRRGGGGSYGYDRPPRAAAPDAAYGDSAAPVDAAPRARGYDEDRPRRY